MNEWIVAPVDSSDAQSIPFNTKVDSTANHCRSPLHWTGAGVCIQLTEPVVWMVNSYVTKFALVASSGGWIQLKLRWMRCGLLLLLIETWLFSPLSFYVSGPHCIAGDVTGALVQSNGPMANNFFFLSFPYCWHFIGRSFFDIFLYFLIFFLLFNDVIHWRLAPFRAD